jgi:hypothetical protein
LDAIGEAPVSSLSSGLPDAEKAERILDRISKLAQAKGWHVNTDYNYTLTPDEDGRIVVTDDVLRIDADDVDSWRDLTVRELDGKRYVYDKENKTFTFDKGVSFTIVWLLNFEALTPALQNYITSEAARIFQSSEMGSTTLDKFVLREEGEAWAALLDEEAEAEDSNMLLDSPHTAWITRRNSPFYGR